MQIIFQVTPEGVSGTFHLELQIDTPYAGELPIVRTLGTGFRTPVEAVEALVECLQAAVPDLTSLHAAAEKVTELAVGLEDLQANYIPVVERLTDVEEAIRVALRPPKIDAPPQRVNPLLAGVEVAAEHDLQRDQREAAQQQARAARPSIRRSTLDEARQTGTPPADKVSQHKPYGGAIRGKG